MSSSNQQKKRKREDGAASGGGAGAGGGHQAQHDPARDPVVQAALELRLWADPSDAGFGKGMLAKVVAFANEVKGKAEQGLSDIAAKEAHTVGNYAIQVTWNDDHSSGLFSYRHLRKVAADSETQGVSSASGVV